MSDTPITDAAQDADNGDTTGLSINHKNGVKTDNRPENLELSNESDQMKHAYRVLGIKHWASKVSPLDVLTIRARRAAGESLENLARDFKMTKVSVGKIALGRSYQHIK